MIALLLAATVAVGGNCQPTQNSTGFASHLYAPFGQSVWSVDHLPPTSFGILMVAQRPNVPGLQWGDGELCLHPLLMQRGPVKLSNQFGAVSGTVPPEWSAHFLQYIYRDDPTWNTTNVVKID